MISIERNQSMKVIAMSPIVVGVCHGRNHLDWVSRIGLLSRIRFLPLKIIPIDFLDSVRGRNDSLNHHRN